MVLSDQAFAGQHRPGKPSIGFNRKLFQVLEIDMGGLGLIEPGSTLLDVLDVEGLDDLANFHDLAVVPGIPTQQGNGVAHGGRKKMALLVFLDQGSPVTLAHLALAHLRVFQDQWQVSELRRLHAERVEQLNVLAGVAQMILPANNVGDVHRDVVHHVDKMECRTAVRSTNDKVLGLRPDHFSADGIVDFHRSGFHLLHFLAVVFVEFGVALPFQLEEDCPVLLVGAVSSFQLGQVFLVDITTLALEIGTIFTPDFRSLVPIHAQPAHPLQEHVQCFLRIAGGIGVLYAQDKLPPGMAGIEPVKQCRSRTPNVEEPGRTWCKAYTYF